jgi:hypothetical protein
MRKDILATMKKKEALWAHLSYRAKKMYLENQM